jgi:phosphate uptake regulator
MFRWFRESGDGLAEVEDVFATMLADDRHVFDLAMSARVGGADPETVGEELDRTEERTDEAERRIRRLVLVHASVHGSADLAACLMYMSIAKDAERIADLSKNLFGIAVTVGAPPPGSLRDELVHMRDTISPMITEAAHIFAEDDREAAEAFIETARELQTTSRDRIDALLREELEAPQPAATALTYRHLSRIVANLLNIVSAVVMPLDQVGYPKREAGT